MVEMRETAQLLDGLTERSLLLLDEVGRGTSTYDGLAIAWALTEHLHDYTRAKVLFATHFHELTGLCRILPRVKNLRAVVREWGNEVIFLRRIVDGVADRSYGIEVARLAGLPQSVLTRAREILTRLEQGELTGLGTGNLPRRTPETGSAGQLNLFQPTASWLAEELGQLDVERLTPIEALNILARWIERSHQENTRGPGSSA
jgi:DNA mismatch repair protein MutS